jgi:glycosyltransferase involved in cell wall biosynthesis
VRDRIARHWHVEAPVLYPPHGVDITGEQEPMPGINPGFLLVVSRLVAHKRVEVLTAAMSQLPDLQLVLVGSGPQAIPLQASAPNNCLFLEDVSDANLRWLYTNSIALLSAAFEDFGLAAVEAMALGRPAVVLRAGGFLETVIEGETGIFFDNQESHEVVRAVRELLTHPLDARKIAAHAARFDEANFARKLHGFAAQLLA